MYVCGSKVDDVKVLDLETVVQRHATRCSQGTESFVLCHMHFVTILSSGKSSACNSGVNPTFRWVLGLDSKWP